MTRRVRELVLGLLVAVGLALALGACGSGGGGGTDGGATQSAIQIPARPEGDGTFRLGTQPWIGYGPFTLAQQRGIFEREGLNVSITNFKEDKQINAAIASRRLDGLNAGLIQALNFAQAHLGTKVVLVEDISTRADAILAGPDIRSVADLRGKKVAYEEGTTAEVLLRYALRANGMSIDDIVKVPIAATEAGPAIIAGRVDAAYTYEPFVTSALDAGKGIHAIFTAGEKPGLISDAFIVRDDVIEQTPGRVAAMIRSWQQALDYYKANTGAAQGAIAQDLGADPGSLTTAFDGITFYDVDSNRSGFKSGELYDTIGVVAQIAKEAGLVSGDIDVRDLVDTRFVDAAAR